MNWQTALLMLLVALWAVTQYGLAAHAIMDLRRRPTVRGNNKVVWALVILGLPIVGALAYAVYGPTSFIRRDRLIATVPTVPVSAVRPALTPAASSSDHPDERPFPAESPQTARPVRSAGARAAGQPDRTDRAIRHATAPRPPDHLPPMPDLDGRQTDEEPAPPSNGMGPASRRTNPDRRGQHRSARP